MSKENVVILGASDNPERYSNKALKMLADFGHLPIPVNPKVVEISGYKTYKTLADLSKEHVSVDTITMYVRPEISKEMLGDLIAISPKRVIFNPGSENPEIYQKIREADIKVEEACTLVLLRTNQY